MKFLDQKEHFGFFQFLKEYLENKGFKISLIEEIQTKLHVIEVKTYDPVDGRTISIVHPPDTSLSLKDNKTMATPFKRVSKAQDTAITRRDLSSVIEQNNYTNLYLQS